MKYEVCSSVTSGSKEENGWYHWITLPGRFSVVPSQYHRAVWRGVVYSDNYLIKQFLSHLYKLASLSFNKIYNYDDNKVVTPLKNLSNVFHLYRQILVERELYHNI